MSAAISPMANIINPGKGFDLTALSQSTDYEAQAMPSIIDTLIDMFPSNIFTSFTNTNMLQIIMFSVFLGVALIMMGKEGERLLAGVQSCANAMYKITAIVMEFSPIGVCALLADSVGAYGLKIFGPLGKLILTVYASDVILVLLMYIPMVALLARFPVKKWLQGIWKVWVVTASTTSTKIPRDANRIIFVFVALSIVLLFFRFLFYPDNLLYKLVKEKSRHVLRKLRRGSHDLPFRPDKKP